MARTIPHRELRNNSSAVLREVRAGETIEVTNNGEVVALLVPPPRRPGALLRARRATVRGGFSALPRATLDHAVQDDLDQLRGDR
ncbi:type II toxin-antitoxin system Phd/YefM family antitoxin [Pseudonocardia sichuanensis]